MLREIYYQFLAYRSLIRPFLVVSAILVPCWLLFRWFRSRGGGRSVSVGREALLLVFVVYLGCLAAATLEPNYHPRFRIEDTTGIEFRPDLLTLTCSPAFAPAGSSVPAFCGYNAKGNLLLFLPLGLLVPLIWKRLSMWKGILVAIGLSVAIEILQLFSRSWGSYRATDINDVLLNVFGAFIGLAIVFLLRFTARSLPMRYAVRS